MNDLRARNVRTVWLILSGVGLLVFASFMVGIRW